MTDQCNFYNVIKVNRICFFFYVVLALHFYIYIGFKKNKITHYMFTVRLDGCRCSSLIKGSRMLFDAGRVRVRDFAEAGQDNLCAFVISSFLWTAPSDASNAVRGSWSHSHPNLISSLLLVPMVHGLKKYGAPFGKLALFFFAIAGMVGFMIVLTIHSVPKSATREMK